MARDLLSVVNTVAGELGLPQSTVAASSASTQTQQLVALAKATGYELMQDAIWPNLRKTATLTLAASTTLYTITATVSGQVFSCDRILDETGWDQTMQWEFVGNVDDQLWNVMVYGLGVAPIHRIFRTVDKNIIEVFPVPTEAATLVLSFMSDCWVLNSAGNVQTTFLADTDTHIFDERLFALGVKWRFLRASGLSYDEERDQYDKRLDLRRGQTKPTRSYNLAGRRRGPHLLDYRNTPETGYGP